jgi:hypothetical protein
MRMLEVAALYRGAIGPGLRSIELLQQQSTQAKEEAIGYLVYPSNSNLSYTVMHGLQSQTVPSYQIGSHHILMSCLAVQKVT